MQTSLSISKSSLLIVLILILTLSACLPAVPTSTDQVVEKQLADPTVTPTAPEPESESPTAAEPEDQTPVEPATPTPTEPAQDSEEPAGEPAGSLPEVPDPTPTEPAPEADAAIGGAPLNPLTNQPCQDPDLLDLPPALVSVSNFPITARPQAGLSYAPYVFELFIGEGMTRFLALFYCAFPSETLSGDNTIGPIRSGRLPYESLRKLYNGFLVMASASGEVSAQLGEASNIFGTEADNINSALVDVGKLKGLAEGQAGSEPPHLEANLFDANPPAGGQPADSLWVFYSFLNQVMWTYNPASGAYLRAQDNADGSGEFTQATDRLTGQPLAYENVIVLVANHQVLNSEGTLIDVDLLYRFGKAYLFRDGVMIPVRWSTENGEYEIATGKLRPIRFLDANGDPVALKPGSVWVEMVHTTTTLTETEPGAWKARFYAP